MVVVIYKLGPKVRMMMVLVAGAGNHSNQAKPSDTGLARMSQASQESSQPHKRQAAWLAGYNNKQPTANNIRTDGSIHELSEMKCEW